MTEYNLQQAAERVVEVFDLEARRAPWISVEQAKALNQLEEAVEEGLHPPDKVTVYADGKAVPSYVVEKRGRNRIKCGKCGDVIESKTRYNMVMCTCGAIAVDGGRDYFKRSAKDMDDVIELDDD